jgi:hypothetical protein
MEFLTNLVFPTAIENWKQVKKICQKIQIKDDSHLPHTMNIANYPTLIS